MDDVTSQTRGAAREQADRLSQALERADFRGWDPYDALSSRFLRLVARGRFGRRLAIQSLKRSPLNFRPVVGVPRRQHTKALALCVSAYARLGAGPAGERYRELALSLAEELARHGVQKGSGMGWAYDFDVQTRWGYYPAGQPNAVVTAFAAHAFLDVFELASGDGGFAEHARAATRFAVEALVVEEGQELFFAYHPGSRVAIHNANALIAGIFARCSDLDRGAEGIARSALRFTLERQLPNGAWPYGVGRGLAWVDGYHTAYILVSLHHCIARALESTASDRLPLGLRYYMRNLFEASGAPRATPSSLYPVDIHAASSAIWALSTLGARSSEASALARRVLSWTLANMQRDDGRFAFQLHSRYRNSVPYIRWNDAHMLLALACIAPAGETDREPT
jgi:hypothetical protein